MSKADVAVALNIHPAHLSKVFKSEILTQKIRKSAAALFGVDESVFDLGVYHEIPLPDSFVVNEKSGKYDKQIRLDELTAVEVMRYLEEKDRRHYEERARLLGIIENLTKAK